MEVSFRNLQQYLNENISGNTCGHTPQNIDLKAFDKIGDLYDKSIGYLSYLNITSKDIDVVFTGCYPLQDCDVYRCQTCNQVIFSHLNTGGIAPRPEYFIADYGKKYVAEPAVKSVSLKQGLLIAFIDRFHFNFPTSTTKVDYQSYITIHDKSKSHIFNYREHNNGGKTTLHFDLVGPRSLLTLVNDWLEKNT